MPHPFTTLSVFNLNISFNFMVFQLILPCCFICLLSSRPNHSMSCILVKEVFGEGPVMNDRAYLDAPYSIIENKARDLVMLALIIDWHNTEPFKLALIMFRPTQASKIQWSYLKD